MEELLRWDGVWTMRLIELMLPVAVKAEADQARLQFGAVSAAIAGAFSKDGAKPFLEAMSQIEKVADEPEEPARPVREASPASKMLKILGSLGISVKGKAR